MHVRVLLDSVNWSWSEQVAQELQNFFWQIRTMEIVVQCAIASGILEARGYSHSVAETTVSIANDHLVVLT